MLLLYKRKGCVSINHYLKQFRFFLRTAAIFSLFLLILIGQEKTFANIKNKIETNQYAENEFEMSNLYSINMKDRTGKSLLYVACENGNELAIENLLKNNANVENENSKMTLLEVYCVKNYKNCNPKIINMLIQAGENPNTYKTKPPLFLLAQNFKWLSKEEKKNAENTAIALIEAGASILYQNQSILHEAAKANMVELFSKVFYSKEGMSYMNMKNEENKTPWELAVKYGSIDVQRIIRKFDEEYQKNQQAENAQQSTKPTENQQLELQQELEEQIANNKNGVASQRDNIFQNPNQELITKEDFENILYANTTP